MSEKWMVATYDGEIYGVRSVDSDKTVCRFNKPANAEHANLIAAAPAMAEALCGLMDNFGCFDGYADEGSPIGIARAALRLARGEP